MLYRAAKTTAALAAGLAMVCSMALALANPAAADSNGYKRVDITGSMHIVDHDNDSPDDIADVPYTLITVVGPFVPTNTVWAPGCSDEVYGQLWVTVQDTDNQGWVKARVSAALNELDSCPNGDNDGNAHIDWFDIPPNQSVDKTIHVDNQAEGGGDTVDITLHIKNEG